MGIQAYRNTQKVYSTFRKYFEEKNEKSLLFRLSECMLPLLVLGPCFYLCFCVDVRRALARTFSQGVL